jgi:hypothetical protein
MTINTTRALSHWNYFLALEADLVELSRFVEFTADNYNTYSIELAHLLLASASEVDVVLKQLCALLTPGTQAENIENYRRALMPIEPGFACTAVTVPRFGLELTPWINWQDDRSPEWWGDHNKVKHERGAHFPRANLKNVLNAMGGLFISLMFYYRAQVDIESLMPAPQLFMAPRELANLAHTFGGQTGLFFKRTDGQE